MLTPLLNVSIFISLLFSICSPSVNYFFDPSSDFARSFATLLKIVPFIPLSIYSGLHLKLSKKVLLLSFLFCVPLISRFIDFIPLNNINSVCHNSYCSDTSVDPQIFNQILFSLYLPFLYPWLLRTNFPLPIVFPIFWTLLSVIMFILVLLGIANPLHNADYGFFSGVVGNPNSFSAICLLVVSVITFRDDWHYTRSPFIGFVLVCTNLIFSLLSGSALGVLLTSFLLLIFYLSKVLTISSTYSFLKFIFLGFCPMLALFNLNYFESILSNTLDLKSVAVFSKLESILTGAQSASADFRIDYINYGLSYAKHLDCLVIGYCGEGSYVVGDGYLPTLAISFGLPLSILYLFSFYRLNLVFGCLPGFGSFFRRSFYLVPSNHFYVYYSVSLLSLLIVNRIQDYWPAFLCFFLLSNKLNSSIGSTGSTLS